MRNIELTLLILILGLSTGAAHGQTETTLALTHAVVIDGSGGVPVEDATVVIRGDRIEAVGQGVSVPPARESSTCRDGP